MAEVASGAVSALLGVIRNEALLLGGVQGDVQFIKEEMESINSFLMHLARTVPPSGEHDEQVRTWMSQVRLLAQDCNNCIDLYLYRGNPDIHLAKGGFWRYLMWAPWFLRKTMAQRSAAIRLRELKERARDVGDRRMRYGVEVPAKAAAASGQSPSRAAAISTHVAGEGTGDEEQDGGDQLVATVIDHSDRRAFELCSWEDYFKLKLQQWMEDIAWLPIYPPSIAIMASDTHQNDEACALACEALDAGQVHHVLVDIPFVHFDYNPLRPKEILYYILRELQLQQARSQPKAKQQETTSSGQDKGEEQQSQHISKWREERTRKDDIYREQKKFFSEINDNIQQLKLYDKLENVKSEILLVKGDQLQPYLGQIKDDSLEHKVSKEPLGVLLLLLKLAATEQDQLGKKKPKRTLAAFYEDIIEATTLKLKEHIEAGTEQSSLICLSSAQYEHILREMFPKTRDNNAQEQDKNITATTIHEDHIKEITDKVKQDIIREVFPILMTSNSKALQDQDQEQDSSAAKHATMRTLGEDSISSHVAKQETRQGVKEDKGHMIQAIGKQAGHCEIPNSMVHETTEKIDNMKWMIKAQMKIKRIVDNIEQYLKDYTMIILKVDETIDGYLWEETRKALRLLSCMAGALIITTTRSTHQAKEYCCGQWEPIDCSLVGLYHATVLKLTSQKMQQDNCNPQLFHDILDNCDPHEFCMKMFARALYSKPTRSYEELYNLCTTLQAVSPKSLSSIAQKMIKFSYNDLPKEYKSCLLYLAIFPQGHRIRRSTLIGRWVVEGLITTED
ncbi:hypothetical protein QOZ80_5AG0406770 [Eleusine coracana subsp. coracana]|nr:hypothetical protein QOZ80_5AG0406770 [Eleusine coracana subsp. coracana]